MMQSVTSLQAQDKALTYQVAQKEIVHEKLTLLITELSHTLLQIQEQNTQKTIRLDKEYKNKLQELEKEYKEKNDILSFSLKDTANSIEGQRQEANRILEKTKRREDKNLLDSITLEEKYAQFENVSSAQKRLAVDREKELEEKNAAIVLRENNCFTREYTLKVSEDAIRERKEAIKLAESVVAGREDYTRLTSQKAKEQTQKLTTLTDTYEKRLQSFADKEKLLEIRDMKLADREGIAASRV